MKPPPFEYVRAESVEEALSLLGNAGEDGRVIAGGQSLIPMLALRVSRPSVLVDLNGTETLAGIENSGSAVRIGAMTRQARIGRDALIAERLPALKAATRHVGHHQTRNRGTLGGSLSLADPAAEYPAVALALDAEFEVQSQKGARTVPASQFFHGPYMTALEPGEILTAASFPHWPEGSVMTVDEVARRPGDFALVGLAAALTLKGKIIQRAGLAWFGMGPTPMRASKAESALTGQDTDSLDLAEIGRLSIEDVEADSDLHASSQYRKTVGARLAARALKSLLNSKDTP